MESKKVKGFTLMNPKGFTLMADFLKRKKSLMSCRQSGFTLIEVLIVIAILAIVSSLGFLSITGQIAKARDATRKSDLKQLQNAFDLYFNANGKYPCFGTSGCGWSYVDGLVGVAPTYIKKLPQDPKKNTDTCQVYLYSVNGDIADQYTIYARLESDDPAATRVKSAPIGPGSSGDGNVTFTISGGTCGGQMFNYWINNP